MSTLPTLLPYVYEPIEGESMKHKITIDDETFTVYNQKLDINQMSLHKCLQHVVNVKDNVMREVKGYPADVQGEVLNKAFVYTLPLMERALWDNFPTYMDPEGNELDELSLECWERKVRDWILTKSGEEDAEAVLQQLRNWRKPRNVTIIENQNYMRMVNSFIPLMSDRLLAMNEDDFKIAFYNSHPPTWRRAFEENRSQYTSNIGTIAAYMRRKAQQAAENEQKNQQSQKNKHRKRNANGSPKEDVGSSPKKQRSNPEENNLSKEEFQKKLAHLAKHGDPDAVCTLKPNHKNHKLKECKTLQKYKATNTGKKTTGQFAIQSLSEHKLDDDSTTSKDSDSSNSV
jgi:hypothetical protein